MINEQVKAKKVEQKLVSLIMADCSNRHKRNWSEAMRLRYRIKQFKTKNPEKFNASLDVIVAELGKIEQGANSTWSFCRMFSYSNSAKFKPD